MGVEQSREQKNTKEINGQIEQKKRKEKFGSPFFEIVNEKGESQKICKGPFFSVDSNEIEKIYKSLFFDKSRVFVDESRLFTFDEKSEFLINMKSLFDKTLSDDVSDREKQTILRNFENKIIEFQIDLKDKIQRAIIDGITDETALKNTNTLGLIISAASLELKNILKNIVENKDKKSEKEQGDEINIAFLTVKAKTIKSIENLIFGSSPRGERLKFFHSGENYEYFNEPLEHGEEGTSIQLEGYNLKNLPENVLNSNKEIDESIEKIKEEETSPFFEIKDRKTGQAAKICRGPFLDKEFGFLNNITEFFRKALAEKQNKEKAREYLENFRANMEKCSFGLKERMDRTMTDGIKNETALEDTYKLSILAIMAASELGDIFLETVFGEKGKQSEKEIEKKMSSSILRIRRKFIRSIERIILKSKDSEFSGIEELDFPDSKEYKWLKMLVGEETEETKLEDDFESGRGKEYHIPADVLFSGIYEKECDQEVLKGPSAKIVFKKLERKERKENESQEQIPEAEFHELSEKEQKREENITQETEKKSQNQTYEAEFYEIFEGGKEREGGADEKIYKTIEESEFRKEKHEERNFYLIKSINQKLDSYKEVIDKILVRVFSEKDTTEMLLNYKISLGNLREEILILNLTLEDEIERAGNEYKKNRNRYGKKVIDEEAMKTTRILIKNISNWIENARIDTLRYIVKDPDMDVENIADEYLKEINKLRQSLAQSVFGTKMSLIVSGDLAIKNIESGLYIHNLDRFIFKEDAEKMVETIKEQVAEMLEKYKDLRRKEAYTSVCERIKDYIGGTYTTDTMSAREALREKRKLKEEIAKRSMEEWKKECEEKLKRMPPKKAETSADIGFASDLGEIQPKKEGLEKATNEERINALRRLSIEIYLKKTTFTARYYINSIEILYRLVGELNHDSENRKMFKIIEKDIKDVQPPNEEIKNLHDGFIMRLEELLKGITSATERKTKKNMAEAKKEESIEEKPEEEVVKKEWYEVDAGKYKDFADKFKNISGELQKIPSYVSETEVGKIDWKEEKAAIQKESEIEAQAAKEKLKEIWPSEEKINERYENLTKNLKETIKKISQAGENESVDLYLRSIDETSDIEKKLKPIPGYIGLVDYLDSLKHLKNIEDLNLEIDRNSASIVESEIEIDENSTILEKMEKKLKEKQKKEKVLDSEINESNKDIVEFKDELGEIKEKIEEAKEKIEEAKRKIKEAKSKIEKARAEIKMGKEEIEKIREKAKKKAEKMSGEIEKMISKSKKELEKFKPDKNKLEKYLENISGNVTRIDKELSKASAEDKNKFGGYLKALEDAREKADEIHHYLSSFDSRNIEEGAKGEIKKMIINQIGKAISEAEEKLEKL